MFKSYLRVILRVLARNHLFTVISMISLSIGLAFFVLILGYILHEFSYENFHQNRNRIVRVNGSITGENNETEKWARVNDAVYNAAQSEFPEVESAVIIGHQYETSLEYNELEYDAGPTIFTTPSFFDVFSFEMKFGDAQTALEKPYSLLIKEDAIEKYFPDTNPVGQWVMLNDSLNCHIAGIVKTAPTNTQLKFDFLVSYSTLAAAGQKESSWTDLGDKYVFLLMHENADIPAFEAKLNTMLESNLNDDENGKFALWTKPLDTIYFSAYYDGIRGEFFPAGEWDMIIILGVFAIFILVQAIINYINLATARVSHRVKEVSVRKILGAERLQLILQFFGESIVMVLGALLLSLLFYEPFRPMIHEAFDYRALTLNLFKDSNMPYALILIWLTVSFGAGIYPAFYMSRVEPLSLLTQAGRIKTTKSWFRRILVLVQFTVALFFLTSTLIVFRQMDYMTSQDRGFRIDNMLSIPIEGEENVGKSQIFRDELRRRDPSLIMTSSSPTPGMDENTYYSLLFPDENRKEADGMFFRRYITDDNFLNTFDLKLKYGKWLGELDESELKHAMIINEGMVEALEIKNPIGHRFYGTNDRFYEVVGVLENFTSSLESWRSATKIMITSSEDKLDHLTIQLEEDKIPETLAMVRQTWSELFPNQTFEYNFLDDLNQANLRDEYNTGYMFAVIAAISILLSGLGIFGLVTYSADQRTREIGIRKVLGGSDLSMMWLVTKEFFILILISNVLALPLSLLMTRTFIQQFVFQVPIGPESFLLPALAAVLLAIFSAGWQAFKASKMRPIDTLRYD